MRRIVRLFSVATIMCSALVARPQANSTLPRSIEPALKPCTDKNAAPCADKAPQATHAPDPEYSKQAAKAKINGLVVLAMVVGTDGRAHNISVVKPLGYGLDEQAVRAVEKWRFKPGQSAGKPVAVEVRVEVNFRYPYTD